MKILKYLSIVLAGLFLFVACQKELSVESGFAGKVATGSLLDSAGNCQNITVNGTYYIDSTLTSDNYVSVQVNFATGGSYRIFTDTQNGFSFQDSGYLPSGLQTIRLKATGRPVSARETTFTVAFDTTFCTFSVTVIGRTPATYSLVASGASCSSSNVQGTYTTGIALNTSNQVALQVNVTSLGSYNVTAGPVGGMTFSGTGNFTTLGNQTITLQGSGTPTTAGTNTVPVTAGSSTCTFSVTVTAGTTGPIVIDNDADSAWEFTEGGKFFHGSFNDVFDTTINGAKGIIFLGSTYATGDTVINFGAFSPTGTIQPGVYSSKNTLSAFYFTDYFTSTAGVDIYSADPDPAATVDTKITITSYDETAGTVIGTFTGTVLTAANTAATITNGKFRAKIR
jgi:hypothetical protein